MGWIKFTLSDETEMAFRKKAMERFGYSKGSLSLAAEEAVKQWLAKRQKDGHVKL